MGAGHGDQNQHKAELTQVAEQVGVIDAANTMSNVVNNAFGAHVRFFGETNFEGHHLNTMIDMVDSAKPEHLETAGKAMWDARDAISEAAEELNGHIGRVDWTGEAADSFNTWGSKLVTHARQLATFAEAAGTQITAAATGLASVRSSMPPRDTRANPKTVAEIPHVKRVESNHEYAAAVQVEDHRQEAINQMNRLASFYSVSEEALAAQEPPVFETMPDVGVPKPLLAGDHDPVSHGSDSDGKTTGKDVKPVVHTAVTSHAAVSVHGGKTPHVDTPSVPAAHHVPLNSQPSVGTEIAGAAVLPTQPVGHTGSTPLPPAVSHNGGPSTSGVSVVGPVSPVFGGSGTGSAAFSRASGTGARSISAQGRGGASSSAAGGRTGSGPLGRATTSGQSGARGTSASPSSSRAPIGRGISGGTPQAAKSPGSTGRGAVGGARGTGGRGSGVVGGRPSATPTGKQASRIPRGNVVGAEGASGSRSAAGRLGQRGVVGSGTKGKGVGPARQGAGGVEADSGGVTGKPVGKGTPARSRSGLGGSAGGRGISGGKRKQRKSRREERSETNRDSTRRPTDRPRAEDHERGSEEA
ncbi:WXG100 family type VII secretion target [Streptomyces sp. NPDC090306]|uniref:WXG100 family type VII secretion target n=1 Tax=Streptomyces sp. NPDC090306 TaxID=3365961 RepID=UPI00380C170D